MKKQRGVCCEKTQKHELIENQPVFMVKFKPGLLHEAWTNYPSLHRSNREEKALWSPTRSGNNKLSVLPKIALRLDIQNLPLSIEN